MESKAKDPACYTYTHLSYNITKSLGTAYLEYQKAFSKVPHCKLHSNNQVLRVKCSNSF